MHRRAAQRLLTLLANLGKRMDSNKEEGMFFKLLKLNYRHTACTSV